MQLEGVKEINPNNYGGMVSRAIPFERNDLDFAKGIETIATTDAAVEVVDWERWEVIREILPMKYAVIPDKVPLLDSHSRFSVEQVKGSAKDFRTNDNQLLCKCFVSDSEASIKEKIREGHIDSVSIGYRTYKDYTVEVPKGKEITIDGTNYKNDFEDGKALVVRTRWQTIELSLVPIGADDAAKFKSLQSEESKRLFDKLAEQERKIEEINEKITKKTKHKSILEKQIILNQNKLQQWH